MNQKPMEADRQRAYRLLVAAGMMHLKWDLACCKGRFPWFQTPNMDHLAAEGVRFRNAFVTNSLCSPSRACFLTGRYNHLNGVANNHTPFPVENVTYATLLRAAGYTTGYIGKWHMDGQRGRRTGFDYSASFVGQGRLGAAVDAAQAP